MSAITTLASGETGANSRTIINDNFAALNADKLEASDLAAYATKANAVFTGSFTINTSLTGILRADAGVVSVDSDITDLVSAASTTLAGKVELAITSEINTGTDTTRAMGVAEFVASKRNYRYLIYRAVDSATNNAIGTKYSGDLVLPFAGTIVDIGATVDTAGTTGLMTVDVNKNGTTLMSATKITLDSTEKTSRTAATAPVLTTTALAVGDIITVDVDGIQTTPAKGLTIFLTVRES